MRWKQLSFHLKHESIPSHNDPAPGRGWINTGCSLLPGHALEIDDAVPGPRIQRLQCRKNHGSDIVDLPFPMIWIEAANLLLKAGEPTSLIKADNGIAALQKAELDGHISQKDGFEGAQQLSPNALSLHIRQNSDGTNTADQCRLRTNFDLPPC